MDSFRKLVIETVIARLIEDKKNTEEQIKTTQQAINEAPSAMQSHSDKTRYELERQLDALVNTHRKLERTIPRLQSLKDKLVAGTFAIIDIGAIVTLKINNGESQKFIVLPEASMVEITIEGKNIVVISPEAPLVKSVWGCSKGEIKQFEVGPVVQHAEVLDVK